MGLAEAPQRGLSGLTQNRKQESFFVTDMQLLPTDFERFRPEIQNNPEYNAERLEVRRKLDAIGKYLGKALAKEAPLVSRASLHHPYKFNRFRVESQWVYLSRADKERKAIKSLLGVELGKDLNQNYVHVLLVLEVHQHGIELALRIHKDAWWDGENLKRRCKLQEEREAFALLLQAVPDYLLRIHDFKNHHACASIDAGEIRDTLKYYTPGEHWLHVFREIPRDDPFVTEDDFAARVEAELRALMPVYRFCTWSPKSNYLFE